MKLLRLTYIGTIDVPATTNADKVYDTKTFALGGGDWSIEVYDIDDKVIAEFVGSNGTRPDEEGDDLWERFNNWCDEIVIPAHKEKRYKAPDGSTGSYSYFKREFMHGRLHGLIAAF